MQQFSKLQRTVQFCYWALNYLEFPDSSNVQVAEWSNAEVCKTSYRGFKSHPELLIQNRLTGRSAPFEGVRLGSNPSSGTKPD